MIDLSCIKQLEKYSSQIPGDMSIGCDGVQVGGSSNLLFTKCKGPVTQFLGLVQLEDKVHVTDAEAEAGCKIVSEALSFGVGSCVSIAVDNAAEGMAQKLPMMLAEKDDATSACSIIVTRDLAHSIDLGPKDLANEEQFVKPVVDNSVNLIKLVCIDRVGGIKKKLEGLGLIKPKEAHIHPDTRMYLIALTLSSASGQRPFLNTLPSRPEWSEYLKSRKKKVRVNLEKSLSLNTHTH